MHTHTQKKTLIGSKLSADRRRILKLFFLVFQTCSYTFFHLHVCNFFFLAKKIVIHCEPVLIAQNNSL